MAAAFLPTSSRERLRVNPEFAAKVYDTLTPGTTVIITDQPVVRSRGKAAVLEG